MATPENVFVPGSDVKESVADSLLQSVMPQCTITKSGLARNTDLWEKILQHGTSLLDTYVSIEGLDKD